MSSIESKLVDFGLKLFQKLSNERNTVFSPISVTTCLSMLLMGSRGTSADELSAALLGKAIGSKFNEHLAQQLRSMANKCFPKDSNTAVSTNLMYIDSKYNVFSQFKQLIGKYFSVQIKELDFKSKSKSIDAINSDISDATNGKIDRLLEDMADDTVVVLANALYFKGVWKDVFQKSNTTQHKFTTNGSQQVDVQMMCRSGDVVFGYSLYLNAKAVQLDYENTNVFMIVLLPDINSSLRQLRYNLSVDTLNDLVQCLCRRLVHLWLPSFKVESTHQLIPSLKKIGIKSIFDKSADFSRLSPENDLIVSQIIQRAVIEVNEEGTEAAAPSACSGRGRGRSRGTGPVYEEFKANRPFMYLFVTKTEVQTIGSIVFIGEFNNPND